MQGFNTSVSHMASSDGMTAYMTHQEQIRYGKAQEKFQSIQDECSAIKKRAERQTKRNQKLYRHTLGQSRRTRRSFSKINQIAKKDSGQKGAMQTEADLENYNEFTEMISQFYGSNAAKRKNNLLPTGKPPTAGNSKKNKH